MRNRYMLLQHLVAKSGALPESDVLLPAIRQDYDQRCATYYLSVNLPPHVHCFLETFLINFKITIKTINRKFITK